MRALFLLLCLGALTAQAADTTAPVVEVPAAPPGQWTELKAQPGRVLILSATTAAKWVAVDDGCDLVPSSDGKTAVFVAGNAGRYRLVVVVGGEPSRVAVTVGTPKPPDPPQPKDALTVSLSAAYAADTSPTKASQVKDLAALYRQAAILTADSTVTTSGQLLQRVQAAAKTLVGPGSLAGVRAIAAGELGKLLPVDAALTDAQRTAAGSLFTKLAALLEGLQ